MRGLALLALSLPSLTAGAETGGAQTAGAHKAHSMVASDGLLPGLGFQLMDGDAEPSLLVSILPYRQYKPQLGRHQLHQAQAHPKTYSQRFTAAIQSFNPEYESGAPSSDAAITAVSLRGYALFKLGGTWYGSVGVGLRHRHLAESWVTLTDESVLAELNRGDAYGHVGLSYAWQRESVLIWVDLIGLQARAATLYQSDNLASFDVLPYWQDQLRANFNRQADHRLRLTLIGVSIYPTD